MHFLINVVVLLCLSINYALCSGGCFSRHYHGQDSFVCVCHQRKCGTLPKHLSKIAEDQVVSYESDIRKYRFHKEIINLATYNDHLSRGSKNDVVQIIVDPSQLGGEIFGFGAAFTDSTGINILKLPSHLQDRLLKDYFDQDGLEYTMGRVPIGGTDFSDRNYTLADDENDFELKNFSLTHDDHLYKVLNPKILILEGEKILHFDFLSDSIHQKSSKIISIIASHDLIMGLTWVDEDKWKNGLHGYFDWPT